MEKIYKIIIKVNNFFLYKKIKNSLFFLNNFFYKKNYKKILRKLMKKKIINYFSSLVLLYSIFEQAGQFEIEVVNSQSFNQIIKKNKTTLVYFVTKIDAETGNFYIDLLSCQKDLISLNRESFHLYIYEGKPSYSIMKALNIKDYGFVEATYLFYNYAKNFEKFKGKKMKKFFKIWFERIMRDNEKILIPRFSQLNLLQELPKNNRNKESKVKGCLIFCGDLNSEDFSIFEKQQKNFKEYLFYYSQDEQICRRLNLRVKNEPLDVFEFTVEENVKFTPEEREKSLKNLKVRLDRYLLDGKMKLIDYLNQIKHYPWYRVMQVKKFKKDVYKRSEFKKNSIFLVYFKKNFEIESEFRNYPKWFYFCLSEQSVSKNSILEFLEESEKKN